MAGETILVVEDNAMSRKLVLTVLKAHGYRVLLAVDGAEGIETAVRERPDLILMDLQLPKISGYDVTRVLKSRPETAHIPILALTAHAMDEERERARRAGCDGYITKPIDTRALSPLIRKYLDGRGSSEQRR